MNNSEIKILIIDDEKNIREGLAESLNEKDYKVYQAKSSREALSYLNKNSFDIALTDLKMPETDGIEFLEIVKEKQPDIDVIIMTAYGTVETAVEALKKGAYDYLTKPIDIKNLRTYIKNLAERRRLIKENLDLKSKLRKRLELDGIIANLSRKSDWQLRKDILILRILQRKWQKQLTVIISLSQEVRMVQ